MIHLRGHTPGGIALLYDDPEGPPHVFTGDSLFPGGVGKTTPDTFAQLFDDVKARLFDRLPDETWFYPGHGKDSTLGAERPHLDRMACPRVVMPVATATASNAQVTPEPLRKPLVSAANCCRSCAASRCRSVGRNLWERCLRDGPRAPLRADPHC